MENLNFFYEIPYFNILNMSVKYHEKIQSLDRFSGVFVYMEK